MTDTEPTSAEDPGEPTKEHPVVEVVTERLEGGPPPRQDPPDGARSDPHAPPLDRLDDYVNLRPDDPRRIEAARILAGRRRRTPAGRRGRGRGRRRPPPGALVALRRVAIPSPNYSSRGGATVRLIVFHTAEGRRPTNRSAPTQGNVEASSHVGN